MRHARNMAVTPAAETSHMTTRRKDAESTMRAAVMSFLESKAVDEIADYLSRGRRHASLQNSELLSAWKAALWAMAKDPLSDDIRADYSDLNAEVRHRGIDDSFGDADARAALDEYAARVDEIAAEVSRNPEENERVEREMLRDLEDYQKKRDRPQ